MTTQSIAAFGFVNQTTSRENIGAFAAVNETVITGSLAETTGSAAALGLSGSLGATAGAGVALSLSGSLAEITGSVSVLGSAGALGSIAGAALPLALSGSLAAAGGSGEVLAISETLGPVSCPITAFGSFVRTGQRQGIGYRGSHNENVLSVPDNTAIAEAAGAAIVVGLSGSIGRVVGVAYVQQITPTTRQAITAYSHINVVGSRQGISAYGVVNEAPVANSGVAEAAGAATVAATSGSVGVVVGAGTPLGESPSGPVASGAVVGQATVLAFSGSIARAVGAAVVDATEPDGDHFLSGSLGNCVGAAFVNAIGVNEGDHIGEVTGVAICAAEGGGPPGVATAVGSSVCLAESAPYAPVGIGNCTGSSVVIAESGSVGVIDGLAVVQAITPDGNIGICNGLAICEAFQPPLGLAYGAAEVIGVSGSVGEASGAADGVFVNFGTILEASGEAFCEALSGSIGTAVGDSSALASMIIGTPPVPGAGSVVSEGGGGGGGSRHRARDGAGKVDLGGIKAFKRLDQIKAKGKKLSDLPPGVLEIEDDEEFELALEFGPEEGEDLAAILRLLKELV